MILNRIATAVKNQDWFVVVLEIFIVVFGVFIGLQVDDWNEARKDKALGQEYLARLIEDLESDAELFAHGVRVTRLRQENLELIWQAAQNPEAPIPDPSAVVVSMRTAGFMMIPSLKRTTYNELLASGAFNLVGPLEIREEVSQYYENYVNARQWDDLFRAVQMRYREAVGGVLPVSLEQEIQRKMGPDQLMPVLESITEEEARQFLDLYIARSELFNILPELASHQVRLIRDHQSVVDRAEALIAVLKTELGEGE